MKYVNLPTQCWLSDKESVCNARDTGGVDLIPGSGRSPGERNSNPLRVTKKPLDESESGE